MEKVDLKFRIQDAHLAGLITKVGMNPEYAELLHDYAPRSRGKEHTPYARFYRDRVSGRSIMVGGILPHVTNAGFFVVPRFRTKGKKFLAEENCFELEVKANGQVKLVCPSDQPTGYKKFDKLIYTPDLFIGGVKQKPLGEAKLLDIDPINPNYGDNVLMWNYGACIRRIRIHEGRFRERWITSYRGIVEIAHNFQGKNPIKIGQCRRADGEPVIVQVIGDREIIDTTDFPDSAFPVEIGASATYYPDPNPETASVDGSVSGYATDQTWAEIRGNVGTTAYPTYATMFCAYIQADPTTNLWLDLIRGVALFDSSGLPDACTISAATFSIHGTSKSDGLSCTPDVNAYSSAPAANDDLVAGDFDSLGTTAYCDTTITYANWSTVAYNDFALNATGIAAISKTGVTKLGTREVTHDVGNSEPGWVGGGALSDLSGLCAETGDTTSDPKLVVTYTTGATIPPLMRHYMEK